MAFAAWDWPPFDILGDTLRGTPATSWLTCGADPASCTTRWKSRPRIFIEYGSGARGPADPVHLDLGPQVDT